MAELIKENFESYRKRVGFNASTAKQRMQGKSWAQIKYDKEHPKEPSKSLVLGRLLHTLLLEPEEYLNEFALWCGVNRTTKAGKAEWERFSEEINGRTVIQESDKRAAMEMVKSIKSNSLLAAYLAEARRKEITATWVDEETNVPAKGRFDALNVASSMVIDPKTCADVSAYAIERSMDKFFYYEQAAWYLSATDALGLYCEQCLFIFVQNCPPYESRGVVVFKDELKDSLAVVRRYAREYQQCVDTGVWPSHPQSLLTPRRKNWRNIT